MTSCYRALNEVKLDGAWHSKRRRCCHTKTEMWTKAGVNESLQQPIWQTKRIVFHSIVLTLLAARVSVVSTSLQSVIAITHKWSHYKSTNQDRWSACRGICGQSLMCSLQNDAVNKWIQLIGIKSQSQMTAIRVMTNKHPFLSISLSVGIISLRSLGQHLLFRCLHLTSWSFTKVLLLICLGTREHREASWSQISS